MNIPNSLAVLALSLFKNLGVMKVTYISDFSEMRKDTEFNDFRAAHKMDEDMYWALEEELDELQKEGWKPFIKQPDTIFIVKLDDGDERILVHKIK